MLFLSTPSSQRATSAYTGYLRPPRYFYPRPLRRGRQFKVYEITSPEQFLSTPSSQRATFFVFLVTVREHFYPRPLRRGRPTRSPGTTGCHNFYPRPLRRGRRADAIRETATKKFLSTPTSQRATSRPAGNGNDPDDFYPRPLRRGRLRPI